MALSLAQVFDLNRLSVGLKRVGPIGLQISSTELHLVQMQKTADGAIEVRAHASLPVPVSRKQLFDSPAVMKKLVRDGLRANKFSGRKVVATLPASETRIFSLDYRVSQGQSDADVILDVLADRLEKDISEYVIDFVPVRVDRSKEDRLAIVALAERDKVIAFLELLRHAGLEVSALEVGPQAIRRLVSAISSKDKYENTLVINFGQSASYMSIISGNRLLFDQEVHLGEQQLIARISSALDMSESEVHRMLGQYGLEPTAAQLGGDAGMASTLRGIIKPTFIDLIDEINRALVYTASQTRGSSIDRILLLGSIARWQGASNLLTSLIQVPVEVVPDPLRSFMSSVEGNAIVSDRQSKPELAVAAGLALRDLLSND